jgi:hypothetical protein
MACFRVKFTSASVFENIVIHATWQQPRCASFDDFGSGLSEVTFEGAFLDVASKCREPRTQ